MHLQHQNVIDLRLKGESYREISKITGVCKSSVSRWCKNLKLPLKIQRILKKKTKASQSLLVAYNKKRHRIVQLENKQIRKKSADQIRLLSKHELLLIGTALYWGEGYKKQLKSKSPYVDFVNSDPYMIILFLRFLQEILETPEEKIKVSIRIHPNINEQSTLNFWSTTTNISPSRFRITRQISKASKGKRSKNSLPNGVLSIRVYNRRKFFQIRGWIDGLIQRT
ncbi:MAG: helix-turn-helix domain-containing protein [Patescibacteria group bacterium]|nr:helix-turn-helix domain-containing protein [Patescibacteria group bacterium]